MRGPVGKKLSYCANGLRYICHNRPACFIRQVGASKAEKQRFCSRSPEPGKKAAKNGITAQTMRERGFYTHFGVQEQAPWRLRRHFAIFRSGAGGLPAYGPVDDRAGGLKGGIDADIGRIEDNGPFRYAKRRFRAV